MKYFVYLISITLVILNSSIVYAQAQLSGQAKVDSLIKELPKAKQDTNQVNLLWSLSFEYYSNDPDKGIEYGEKGLELAKIINWKKGEANCYNALGTNNFGKANYEKALKSYLKALKINEELGNKSGLASNLGNIGTIYSFQSDYPKAREYYYKALKINEELGAKSGLASNFSNIGLIYSNESDYPKALEYYHKALKINEEMGRKEGVANNLGNMGVIFKEQSNYPKALEYYYKSLKIFEELGDKFGLASNLGNIGNIYAYQFDFPKALDYHQKALKINEELGDKSGLAVNLNNIGNVYSDQSDYPKALEYYHKALKINEEMGSKEGVANNLGNMGRLYYGLSQDTVLSKINDSTNLFSLNKEINLNKSIEYTLESVKLLEEIGELHSQFYFLNILSQAYQLKGDYKKAYESFKKYKELNDSVFSIEKQKELANLESRRENEIKDKEIIILQTEKKSQKYLLGSGIIIALILFVIALIRFREKKNLSDELAKQNAEIETQKSIVEEKNEQIVSSITYASTIQQAILPWEITLKNAFAEIFIFYKPKDIVSGDSYWFQEVDGIKFLAVIDCTGHGIPGAMLTVIASSVLDDAVLGKRLNDTGQILTYMNEKVTEVLNQKLAENKIRDGMEVCLIAIHNDKIQFSGAGRPLYIKNGTMEIVKTDKRGIAGQTENDEYQFSSVDIEKADNITLYLTSDGFADQMNENSKKYSTKRFVALLDSISEKPISEQSTLLENEFNSHKSERSQIDDVTILGVRV